MKAKILMFMMAIGMLLTAPALTYAQYTDEDLEFQGCDPTEGVFGPVSLDPTLIEGVLSHANQTLTLNFLFDLQTVTISITDGKGVQYIREEVNTSTEATTTIDVVSLPAGKYTVICYTPAGIQKADFEIHPKRQ